MFDPSQVHRLDGHVFYTIPLTGKFRSETLIETAWEIQRAEGAGPRTDNYSVGVAGFFGTETAEACQSENDPNEYSGHRATPGPATSHPADLIGWGAEIPFF